MWPKIVSYIQASMGAYPEHYSNALKTLHIEPILIGIINSISMNAVFL